MGTRRGILVPSSLMYLLSRGKHRLYTSFMRKDISIVSGLEGMTLTELDYQNTIEEPIPNGAQKLRKGEA